MKLPDILLAAAVIAAPVYVLAEDKPGHSHDHPAAAQASTGLAEGEVRKVDTEQGKVTLKHGAIENLGMTPMTMIFRVSDPAMLSRLKAGDKIKFKADRINGAFTITEIAPAS